MKATNTLLAEDLDIEDPPNEPFFVDFLREAPEATGDEPEDADLDAPKVYEQVITLIMLYHLTLLCMLGT